MSATLIINNESSWMPGSGLFLIVLELIANEIENGDSILAKELRKIVTYQGSILSVENIEEMQFKSFQSVVKTLCSSMLNNWNDYSEYVDRDVIRALSQLKVALSFDRRADKREGNETSSIILNETAIWAVPGWIYDMTLEGIVSWLKDSESSEEAVLGAELMEQQWTHRWQADFRRLSPQQFQLLYLPIRHMYFHYGDEGVRIIRCPQIQQQFAPQVVHLWNLFMADPRVAGLSDEIRL